MNDKIVKLRCPNCKHEVDYPETPEGLRASPLDRLKCTHCGEVWVIQFWIQISEQDIKDWNKDVPSKEGGVP